MDRISAMTLRLNTTASNDLIYDIFYRYGSFNIGHPAYGVVVVEYNRERDCDDAWKTVPQDPRFDKLKTN